MNKYAKLISNTFLFAIGTFSSKVLGFLLLPLYTNFLDKGQLGVADQIVQMSNLMLPLVSVGILNAIIRYGLDKSVRKSDVFTTSLIVILCGFALFLCASPLISHIPYFTGYAPLIYLYVLMSCMRSLCSQFVRAKEYVRLYAIDGVLATLTVLIFNVLFLVVFRWGIVGYVLATIVSDLCSAIFLFVIAKLWRYIRIRPKMNKISFDMLRYAVPLIPTTVSWWLTNMSSRFILSYMLQDQGIEYSGLLSVAYKIPTLVTTISSIFLDAWQMSAVLEGNGKGRAAFFSKVFDAFQSMAFLCASGIITFAKVLMYILTAEEYYEAWQYVPILVMATTFSCMVTFLGSVYMVEKRSVMALVTTLVGAVVNIIICILLVEKYNVNGVAFAMFISYFIVFILRAVSAHRMIHMKWNIPKMLFNLALISVQSYIMIQQVELWILWESLLTLTSFVVNFKPILVQLTTILLNRKKKTADNQ